MTGAGLWIIQFDEIVHGDQTDHDDAVNLADTIYVTVSDELVFDSFPTGKAGFRAWLGVDGPNNKDLLITGGSAGVDGINNDVNDIGLNSQFVNPTGPDDPVEIARLDFVENLDTSADFGSMNNVSFSNHFVASKAGIQLIQTGGPARNEVALQFWAYDSNDSTGAEIVDTLNDAGTEDPIVFVADGLGQ